MRGRTRIPSTGASVHELTIWLESVPLAGIRAWPIRYQANILLSVQNCSLAKLPEERRSPRRRCEVDWRRVRQPSQS